MGRTFFFFPISFPNCYGPPGILFFFPFHIRLCCARLYLVRRYKMRKAKMMRGGVEYDAEKKERPPSSNRSRPERTRSISRTAGPCLAR